MTQETAILTAVIEYLSESDGCFAPVMLGGLTPKSGISAELAPGYTRSEYLAGGALQRMPLLLLVKHGNHKTAMEAAFALAKTARNAHAQSVHGDVAAISAGTAPDFVEKSGTDYIYSLIINIDYVIKRG